MSTWIWWVIAACAFGVGEMLTMSFFLAPFAFGAALAALVSAVGAPDAAAWVVFIACTVLTLLFVRPFVSKQLHSGPALRTGAAALVGKQAIVLERIANDEGAGCVKIDGEVWTARAFDDEVIERGTKVHVMEIKGATA